jgi:fructose-1,6-bisphosphatase I
MAQEHRNPVTLSRFILQEQRLHKEAQGDLTILLASIQLACKVISVSCSKAGILNIYGLDGSKNASGDAVKKLDILSNESFVNALSFSGKVSVMVSEEEDAPIILKDSLDGKYFVAFDPLDGSSNIDANVSVGTIFGIWRQAKPVSKVEELLQPATKLVAAGYALYGSATMMVLSTGNGVHGFTLDPSLGEFVLTHEDMKIPTKGKIYSVNEGNSCNWDAPTREYVERCKAGPKPMSLRYVGSMVADVHRTILYGGIFMYPGDKKVILWFDVKVIFYRVLKANFGCFTKEVLWRS